MGNFQTELYAESLFWLTTPFLSASGRDRNLLPLKKKRSPSGPQPINEQSRLSAGLFFATIVVEASGDALHPGGHARAPTLRWLARANQQPLR